MRYFNTLLLAIVATIAVSCSQTQPPVITPKSRTIRGELGKYFKVVGKPVILTPERQMGQMYQIEIEKIAELPYNKESIYPIGTSGPRARYSAGFGIKLFDKSDNIVFQITPTSSGVQGVYSDDDIVNLINMEVGESGIIRWQREISAQRLLTLATFEISSSLKMLPRAPKNTSYSAQPQDQSSNWNSIINDYEQMVDLLISATQRANAGDFAAFENLADYSNKALELYMALDNVEQELTPSQTQRLMKIATKMANASM